MLYINKREVELANKLKVGDKVRIKSWEKINSILKQYDNILCGFVEETKEYTNKTFTIESYEYYDDYKIELGYVFSLKEIPYSWTSSMFEFDSINKLEVE